MIGWTAAELADLAVQNVTKAPDGSLRDGEGEPVSDGTACEMLGYGPDAHPVQKDVVEPENYHRGPLIAGHAAPSPADAGDNNPVPPVTGSGTVYEPAAELYNANVARERAQHVAPPHECVSEPATASYSPSADMKASSVPQSCDPSSLTGRAPGER